MVIATKSATFLFVSDSLLTIDMIRLVCQSVENPNATMIGSAKSTSAILNLLFGFHYHWEAFLADASVLEPVTPVHAKNGLPSFGTSEKKGLQAAQTEKTLTGSSKLAAKS